MKNSTVYGLMALAALFWAGAFIAGKFTVPYIPVATLTFLRFFFAVVIMTLLFKVGGFGRDENGELFRLEKKHIPVFIFTGIVGMIGYHLLFFTSLKYTTAINSSMINAMNPIMTTIFAGILLKSRFSKMQIFGIIMSFVGVVLTITGADVGVLTELTFNKGDIVMVGAMLCWAVYGVFSKMKGAGIPAFWLTYYSFVSCMVFVSPLVLAEKPWTFIGNIPASAWISVLYMSIFASVIGYMMQQVAIKVIGPSRTSIFINLVPVFSMILAVLILGETLEPVKLLTAALIIAGVCICQLSANDRKDN